MTTSALRSNNFFFFFHRSGRGGNVAWCDGGMAINISNGRRPLTYRYSNESENRKELTTTDMGYSYSVFVFICIRLHFFEYSCVFSIHKKL